MKANTHVQAVVGILLTLAFMAVNAAFDLGLEDPITTRNWWPTRTSV